MWTKLIYSNLQQAMKPSFVNGQWQRPTISGRYKSLLRKQFYKNGVPWIYETIKDDQSNPRNKKPKGHKKDHDKVLRLDKIKKALTINKEAELTHLQAHLNNRKLKGSDKLFQQSIYAFLHLKEGTDLNQAQKRLMARLRGDKEEAIDDFDDD